MNRKELEKKVKAEVLHTVEQTNIDLSQLSDLELSSWIKQLVKRCSE